MQGKNRTDSMEVGVIDPPTSPLLIHSEPLVIFIIGTILLTI